MKSLFRFFALLLPVVGFAFSSSNTNTSTFYYDEYGVTVKCPEASAGATGTLNGKVYTAVNENQLTTAVNNGDDLSCLCTSL
ncbi:MAG: hypothetical protein ACON43_07330, partial [Flavobacteriaceae bacterium]